jgi:uncharacterized membrane protein
MTDKNVPSLEYFIPEKPYQLLKWGGLIAWPALTTFIGVVLIAIQFEGAAVVVTIMGGFGAFVGALLGVSAATGKENKEGD